MYLRISDLAGSSGCVPFLKGRVKNYKFLRSRPNSSSSVQKFSLELGTAVHELIQFVLKYPSESRNEIAEQCAKDLEILRTTLKPSKLLLEAFPNKFLSKGLVVDKIMKAWEHGSNLLRICCDFLTYLEDGLPNSKNNWDIKIEVKLHKNNDGSEYNHSPASKRVIFNQEMALHGSVDLVFEWQDMRILGELKTGRYSEKKEKTWKDQVSIYGDIWKEKHPEHKVSGVVFHASKKPIWVHEAYNFSNLEDPHRRIGGPQCGDCPQKTSCEFSTYVKTRNGFV